MRRIAEEIYVWRAAVPEVTIQRVDLRCYNSPHHAALGAICGVLLLFTAVSGFAGDDSADRKLLADLTEQVNIDSASAKPFQLDIDFTAMIRFPQTGHLTVKWESKDLWSKEVDLADFRQKTIRKGDTLYTSRNGPFTPLRITELQDLITVFSADCADCLQIKGKKQERSGAECFDLHFRRSKWIPERALCFNPTTHLVASDETKDGEELRHKEFSDYQPFGSHFYPRQMKLLIDGSLALDASVTGLRETAFDQATFIPPANAIVRRQCTNLVHPKPINTPDPAYPKSASQNHMGGTAVVAITVLPDGSVSDVQLVGSAGHSMDQVSQEIVRTWKFKPAMCGGEPVANDIRVEFKFRVY